MKFAFISVLGVWNSQQGIICLLWLLALLFLFLLSYWLWSLSSQLFGLRLLSDLLGIFFQLLAFVFSFYLFRWFWTALVGVHLLLFEDTWNLSQRYVITKLLIRILSCNVCQLRVLFAKLSFLWSISLRFHLFGKTWLHIQNFDREALILRWRVFGHIKNCQRSLICYCLSHDQTVCFYGPLHWVCRCRKIATRIRLLQRADSCVASFTVFEDRCTIRLQEQRWHPLSPL